MRKREMQRTRSIAEQRKFYNKIYEDTAKSSRKIANARLRKGLYKDLFEEFLVLLEYSEIKYSMTQILNLNGLEMKNKGTY